jgi:DNA-binding GntR family transcriptional regulator
MTDSSSFFEARPVPIGRLVKSLPEQVAAELATAVADGSLAPGERLKEESLAERFAVSRSTVREAIAILERRGLVERVARYGARVTVVDAAEVEEIFAIRAQLLGLAARVAAEKGDEALLAKLRGQAKTLERLSREPATEPADYAAVSIETQRLLVSANGLKRLTAIYEDMSGLGVWRHAVREKSVSFRTPERRRASALDWKRLVAAIVSRDGDAAERQAKALLQASWRAAESEWKREGGT